MNTDLHVSGVAGASVPAPLGPSSVGEILRFAAYVADLIGNDRLGDVAWDVRAQKLFVDVTDTTHGETLAHLLGLDARFDHAEAFGMDGFSCWTGRSGLVEVFLKAPLALGGLPERRPRTWSASTDAPSVRAVA